MNKSSLLKDLKNQILNSSLPLKETATQLVFGDGNPDADILIIGEAPGANEDRTGLPFVGRAGKLLDQILTNISLQRSDVYITNIIKYRPPANRPPKPDEIASFKPFLETQIKIINPKIIISLGRFALEHFLPLQKISQVHGQPIKIKLNKRSYLLIPMFHPSAGLRNPKIKEILENDFQKMTELL